MDIAAVLHVAWFQFWTAMGSVVIKQYRNECSEEEDSHA